MLAPNQAFLFLGKSHEEALAHLVYAVLEGEGFFSLIWKRGVGNVYPGRILSVTDSTGEIWYTVRIGDFPSHESARRHAAEFSAKEKMKTAVRPYGKL